MRREVSRGTWAAAALTLVACGLDAVTVAPTSSPDATEDAGPTTPSLVPTADGAAADAPDTPPTPVGPVGCAAPPAGPAGSYTAHAPAAPVVVDGDLTEWACATFVHIDTSSWGYRNPPTGPLPPDAYDFAFAWDASYLYVAARAVDATVPSSASANPIDVDSVEVYVDANGALPASYQPDDHQWVVDRTGTKATLQNGSLVSYDAAGFTAAARLTTSGFEVEMRLSVAAMDRRPLAAGDRLGLDFAGNDGTGAMQTSSLGWYRGACSGCCFAFCDPTTFGRLDLEP